MSSLACWPSFLGDPDSEVGGATSRTSSVFDATTAAAVVDGGDGVKLVIWRRESVTMESCLSKAEDGFRRLKSWQNDS